MPPTKLARLLNGGDGALADYEVLEYLLMTAIPRKDVKPGDVILLSPACASFDQFRDYEARGDSFRQIVQALIADQVTAAAEGAR